MRLAERRIGRDLTTDEQRRILTRVRKRGIEVLEDAVLANDLTALKRWIAAPKKAPSTIAKSPRSKTTKTPPKKRALARAAKR